MSRDYRRETHKKPKGEGQSEVDKKIRELEELHRFWTMRKLIDGYWKEEARKYK